jgi:hypothetical protein
MTARFFAIAQNDNVITQYDNTITQNDNIIAYNNKANMTDMVCQRYENIPFDYLHSSHINRIKAISNKRKTSANMSIYFHRLT